jgi:hypothetical protein
MYRKDTLLFKFFALDGLGMPAVFCGRFACAAKVGQGLSPRFPWLPKILQKPGVILRGHAEEGGIGGHLRPPPRNNHRSTGAHRALRLSALAEHNGRNQ